MVKILCVGDLVGRPGRKALKHFLPKLQKEHEIDFTIVNIENVAGGFGVTPKTYNECNRLDVDAFTSGNHIFDKKEIFHNLHNMDNLLRPENYSDDCPGTGIRIFEKNGIEYCVINLIGRAFTGTYNCPFQTFKNTIESLENRPKITVLDFHAETTSETQSMGWYLDGKISAMFGTHTHVQTGDERILNRGTGYITDVGMTGARDSVTGMEIQPIINKFLTQIHHRFSPPETSKVMINAIVFTIDEKTGKTIGVQRLTETTDLKKT